MTDLERRALLGDRQAQEECTRQRIVLRCPFCGRKDVLTLHLNSNIYHNYQSDCVLGGRFVPLSDWDTRAATPVGSCKDCAEKEKSTVNKKGYLICPASGMDITDYDFCSWFKPMESKENEIR